MRQAISCSTPVGINGIFTSANHSFASVWVMVLNACWHQWNFHKICPALSRPARWCSTPVGINGIFTFDSTWVEAGTCGAQRLLASMEFSPFLFDFWLFVAAKCSTPVGINGIFTRCVFRQRGASYRVLNACWHQWNFHCPDGLPNQQTTRVLNACWHQWNFHLSVLSQLSF